MAKVTCDQCGSSFELAVLKAKGSLDVCPVCGASFDENEKVAQSNAVSPEDITDEDVLWNMADKNLRLHYLCEKGAEMECKQCGKYTMVYPNLFSKRSKNYAIFKDKPRCDHCCYTAKSKIVFERKPSTKVTSNIGKPCCPRCGSYDVKRITVADKIGRVALLGVLSAGYMDKMWQCRVCKSRW